MKTSKIAAIAAAVLMAMSTAATVSADEWVKSGNGYAYQYTDGTTAEKGWLKIGNDNYYITADGTRQTGWLKTKTAKYYFGKDGKMYKSRWLTLKSGDKYYLQSNGKAATGVVKVDGTAYKFDKNGICLGKNHKFTLDKKTKCLHGDPKCSAAKKISNSDKSTVNIGESELADRNYNGYWACTESGCNTAAIVDKMPKLEFLVKILSTEIATDRRNNNILVVEYQFTNLSDETTSWGLEVDDTAYQNGVECDTSYSHDFDGKSSTYDKIKPGATATVKVAYIIESTKKDVEIECYKLFDWSDNKKPLLTQTIKLK